VKVPVEGIGTLELSISVSAKMVENDESVEVQVESAAIVGTEPEPDIASDTDSDPVLEPESQETESVEAEPAEAPVEAPVPEPEPKPEPVPEPELAPASTFAEASVDMPEPAPETDIPLPPLGEESAEPLGAPLDGQEGSTVTDSVSDTDPDTELLDFPEVTPPEMLHEDEKILLDEDISPESESVSETGSSQYDPAAEPIDLFAESENEPAPEEPAPKKKGLFGRFKKKHS
jgi:hypothetical protein